MQGRRRFAHASRRPFLRPSCCRPSPSTYPAHPTPPPQFARIYTPVILVACTLLAFLPWIWAAPEDRKVGTAGTAQRALLASHRYPTASPA